MQQAPPTPYQGQPVYQAPPAPQQEARPPRLSRSRRSEAPPGQRRASRAGGGLPFGIGAVIGVTGLACFLAALMVLPWFSAGGEDVDLSKLDSAFSLPETDPDDLPGASAGEPSVGDGGVPSAGEVSDAVEDEVRDTATEAASNAIDSGKSQYLELYVETLWIVVAVGVVLAVLFSTILAPKSFTLGLLLGFRRLSGTVTVLAAGAHGAALWIVFTGDGAPTPAFGVWLGLGGLAAVLLGAIIGPRRNG